MKLDVTQKIGVEGRYRVSVIRDGKVVEDTGWFKNLITNQGLDWFATAPPGSDYTPGGQQIINTHCGVGTGSTAPAVTDTYLTAPLAMFPADTGSYLLAPTTTAYVSGTPSYWSYVWTYNFAVGAVVGNIAEVGVGNTVHTDASPQLFSHALIIVGGSPGTISVLATDALVVNYELRLIIDTTASTAYSMTVSGVTYTGNFARIAITTIPFAYNTLTWDVNGINYAFSVIGYQDATLAALTATDMGSTNSGIFTGNATSSVYAAGSYTLTLSRTAALADINFANYLSGLMIQTHMGNWQFTISPVIPKTSTYTLTLGWTLTWARYP
jgi:hypothetical protein